MNLHIESFDGPFDLLLHLVRVSKMDIYKVNIRDIIDQYIEFINSNDINNIDENSEYLVMSSELVHLKSRMLINKEESYEEEDNEFEIKSEEDLRNKLIEYERYKNITETFKLMEENRAQYYTKLPENLKNYIEDEKEVISGNVTLDDLLNAFLEMQKRIAFRKPVTTKITKKELSVKERCIEIRNILKVKKRVEFSELFDIITKETLVVTFLSILDMSKNNEIVLSQNKNFSTIIIESK